ncbi:hypothetical protein GG344DRAFT_71685, partial [Lentinula edodes]
MPDVTLDQLRAVLTAEAFEVIAPIFSNIAQHLQESEGHVAELQQQRVSTESLSSAFRDAMSHLTPNQPSVSSATARAPLRTELPIFRGRPDENVCAFISIAKDLLKATHIAQEDWGVIKQENSDQPLTWDKMEQALRTQFDNPARMDELRNSLNRCNYKDMTFGD